MKNTSPLPSLSFSLKSNSKPKPPRKPTMLHIKAIPDSNDVKVMAFDHDAVAFVFSFNGNLSLLGNENPDDFSHTNLILGGSHPDPVKLEPFDFAFNFISDADLCSRALDDAIRLVEENSIPCLNHPKLVKQMTRDGVYNYFNHIDGLLIPKTLRVAPHSMREVQELIETGKIRLPLIIRPAGGHNGREMLLLESLEDIYKLECFAFDGRDYFLIEFHDYRSNDGLYRKYRMLWIDGKAYPRHLIIDDVWNIHGKNRYNIMEEHDHLRMEEIAYLENPVTSRPGWISAVWTSALQNRERFLYLKVTRRCTLR
jgi:hypothetical protein